MVLDEAHDTNPVIEEIFLNQDAQRMCVGDPAQLAARVWQCHARPYSVSARTSWSRRIDDEHCLVYIVTEAEIIILAARYHY